MAWAPNYCTAAELASYLRVGDTADDVQLGLAIAAASRAIDQECNRQFGTIAAPIGRIYTARYDDVRTYEQAAQAGALQAYTPRVNDGWSVDIDDLASGVGLLVATDNARDGGFATTITGATLGPVNAVADGRPYTVLRSRTALPTVRDGVRITALWGWSSVPDAVKQACLLQASRVHSRRDSPYGIAGSPDMNSEMRLLAKVDPDVAVILRPYVRRWWAV